MKHITLVLFILGMKAGYTERFLIEPEDPRQTVQIMAKAFDKIFNQPIG